MKDGVGGMPGSGLKAWVAMKDLARFLRLMTTGGEIGGTSRRVVWMNRGVVVGVFDMFGSERVVGVATGPLDDALSVSSLNTRSWGL